jgi:hypothetical protein
MTTPEQMNDEDEEQNKDELLSYDDTEQDMSILIKTLLINNKSPKDRDDNDMAPFPDLITDNEITEVLEIIKHNDINDSNMHLIVKWILSSHSTMDVQITQDIKKMDKKYCNYIQ